VYSIKKLKLRRLSRWAKEAVEELGMKDDLIKSNQWRIVFGDINCEIETNDREDIIETNEIELKQSKPSTITDHSMFFHQFHQRIYLRL